MSSARFTREYFPSGSQYLFWGPSLVFWGLPVVTTPTLHFASQRPPWTDWPEDQRSSRDVEWRRLYFPQTGMQPWRAIDANQQQQGPTEFRRVSDDGWALFRPYWTPPTGVAFFVGQPVPGPWAYWPKDEGKRWEDAWYRVYIPQNGLTPQVGAQAENRQQFGPIEYRRVSDDGWSDYRPFWNPPLPLAPGIGFASQRRPWDEWPKDEGRRWDDAWYRVYIPQTLLASWRVQPEAKQQQGPVEFRRVSDDGWADFRPFWTPPPSAVAFFVGQPVPGPWPYWPKDEASRWNEGWYRLYMPQTGLTPQVGSQAERRQQQGPIEFRRVSDDVWGDFRPFWTQPQTLNPTTAFASQRRPWDDWPKDEARRWEDQWARLYMPQTSLAPWRIFAENRQADGPVEFRRVSDDGWALFRFFWVQPSTTPFFVAYPAPNPWNYWPLDQAVREDIAQWRLFMPQTKLTPMVASQAENRQQMGPIEFRRVTDDGWSEFRPFWVPPPPPPPPPATTSTLWAVGPKGIKTRIQFFSGMNKDEENK